MNKRITQTEAIFYTMYKDRHEAIRESKMPRLIPVHDFMGEVWCAEVSKWGFVSYECSARLSEMYRDNPGLIWRNTIVGKSGAKYYGYRLADDASVDKIKDASLRDFYLKLRAKMVL